MYTIFKAPLRCGAALGSLQILSHLIPIITLPGRYYTPRYRRVDQVACGHTAGESGG